MKEELIKFIAQAPVGPGIYQYLDQNSKALYVGKAKNLKKRLQSYTKSKQLSIRIKKMTSLAHKIEIVQTLSEVDALLLECNLIKKLKPRYNILLKDDKTFPYIEISEDGFGKISKYRGKKNPKNNYFGPFANGFYVDKTLDVIKKSFLLRSCGDSEFKNRKKPCLEYQIKRCSAPCVDFISKNKYQDLLKDAVDFLEGKNSQIQEKLAKKMQELSVALEYEQAAIIRDRIKAVSSIQNKQNIGIFKLGNSDVISLVKKDNICCVYISFYRSGNNYGSKPYFININIDDSEVDIITNFISQFYSKETPPEDVVLSHEINDINLLQEIFKTNFCTPQRGYKLQLIRDQSKIAKSELQQKINQNMSNKENLISLKRLFNLEQIPKRIEVYDNSHISNTNKVGAMICVGMEGFMKNNYRKFNIDEKDINDDTAMMKHVLTRRFKKIEKNDENWPDLLLIDGGKGQLSAAKQVFDNLNLKDINYVCISKGPNRNAGEEFFHQTDKESFTLKKDDPLMYYLQNLRDEAHRFAITTHRKRRSNSTFKSVLDEVSDIGAKRKKLLLNHFGSIEDVKNASEEDLSRIVGIGKKIAKKIKDISF